MSDKARTEPNQTEPTEITEPAQPNLRKLTGNYAYRYRVLAPIPIRTQTLQQLHPLGTRRDSGGHWDRKSPLLGSLIRTLVLLTPSSLIIIIIIIRYIIIIGFTDSTFSQLSHSTG